MKNLTLIILVSLILISCDSVKFTSDYDVAADFSKYKTFIVLPIKRSRTLNDLNARRLKQAIEEQMKKRGYTISDDPDLLVQVTLKKQQKQEASVAAYINNGYYWGGYYYNYTWTPHSGTALMDYEKYTVGTLTISLIDKEDHKLVWFANAQSRVDISTQLNERKVNYLTEKMFKKFPKKD